MVDDIKADISILERVPGNRAHAKLWEYMEKHIPAIRTSIELFIRRYHGRLQRKLTYFSCTTKTFETALPIKRLSVIIWRKDDVPRYEKNVRAFMEAVPDVPFCYINPTYGECSVFLSDSSLRRESRFIPSMLHELLHVVQRPSIFDINAALSGTVGQHPKANRDGVLKPHSKMNAALREYRALYAADLANLIADMLVEKMYLREFDRVVGPIYNPAEDRVMSREMLSLSKHPPHGLFILLACVIHTHIISRAQGLTPRAARLFEKVKQRISPFVNVKLLLEAVDLIDDGCSKADLRETVRKVLSAYPFWDSVELAVSKGGPNGLRAPSEL